MYNRRFEILPHTADKGIRAFGRNLKELLENAAFGMFSLMAELDKYAPAEIREIEVEGADTESLLRTWLAELLYIFEVDRILFVDFEVRAIDPLWSPFSRGTDPSSPPCEGGVGGGPAIDPLWSPFSRGTAENGGAPVLKGTAGTGEGCRLEGVARGLPFNNNIEWLGSAVKAVTHHGLYVHRTDERFEAQIIFDV